MVKIGLEGFKTGFNAQVKEATPREGIKKQQPHTYLLMCPFSVKPPPREYSQMSKSRTSISSQEYMFLRSVCKHTCCSETINGKPIVGYRVT